MDRKTLVALAVVCGCGGSGGTSGTFGGDSASATMTGGATEGTAGTTATSEGSSDTASSVTTTASGVTTSATDTSDGTASTSASTGGATDTSGPIATTTATTDTTGSTSTSTTTGDTTTSGDTTTNGDTTTGVDPDCGAPSSHLECDADDDDPFHAIGLNCPGDATNSTPIQNASFTSPDANAWRVATQFGSSGDFGPKEGDKVLVISTGVLAALDGQGKLLNNDGSTQPGTPNGNPMTKMLPNPIEPKDGSGGVPFMNCDGVNDCSDTLEAQWVLGDSMAEDLLWFKFDLTVPPGTEGYNFDFAWFSSEYPEWVNTMYNDVFVAWSTSETYTGNITFIDDQPLTVTALDGSIQFEGEDPALKDTGFWGKGKGGPMEPTAGSTGWYTALGSASPGETFTLAFAIFDMGDAYYDTTAVIDNWRWSCMGCDVEVDGCGIKPQ